MESAQRSPSPHHPTYQDRNVLDLDQCWRARAGVLEVELTGRNYNVYCDGWTDGTHNHWPLHRTCPARHAISQQECDAHSKYFYRNISQDCLVSDISSMLGQKCSTSWQSHSWKISFNCLVKDCYSSWGGERAVFECPARAGGEGGGAGEVRERHGPGRPATTSRAGTVQWDTSHQ